jgi:integral membrane protein
MIILHKNLGKKMLLQNIHNDLIGKFRIAGFLEGISYILLLFIAMPMKYMYGMPLATKIVGMIHGILFIIFMILLLQAAQKHNFQKSDTIKFFIASLLPFGTFFTDKRLRELEEEI